MKNSSFFSCILFLFAFNSVSLYAEAKHPADISYLVADLKYNKKDGVKIYELQLINKDKSLSNEFFEHSDELKKYKADWRVYPKKYDSLLSARIQKDMPSEFYVIKPRNQTLTRGAIVVANHDLDIILKIILNPSPSLEKNPDKRYSYWVKNKDDTFLVEKFYKSDYLRVPHPLTEKNAKGYGYHYDATMHILFALEHDKGKITYHSLGGFWELPYKALEEKGTLNEKRLPYCEPSFYRAVDPTLLKEVNKQMESVMVLLYEKMLKEHQ